MRYNKMDYYNGLNQQNMPGPCVSNEIMLGKNGSLDAVDIQDLYDSGQMYYQEQEPVQQPMPMPCQLTPKKKSKSNRKSESAWDLKIVGVVACIVALIILIGFLSREPSIGMSVAQ